MNSAMQSVLEFQRNFAQQVSSLDLNSLQPSDKQIKGMAIYQNNFLMTAARALSVSYPVITKMLGEQGITVLAKRLLKVSMPATGDWADWGFDLPRELAASELAEALPFLPDMANLEWHIHRLNRTKQSQFEQLSLELLQQHDLQNLYLKMQNGLTLVTSEYPVVELWRAHRPWDVSYAPQESELLTILSSETAPFYCLVYQNQNYAQVESLSAHQYRLIRDAQNEVSLSALFTIHSHLGFSRWMETAIERGLIEKVVLYLNKTFTKEK